MPRESTHDLKSWQPQFAASWIGHKTFELRRNDRDFRVGDTVVLHEVEVGPDRSTVETGRCIEAVIVQMLENDGVPRHDAPPWVAGLAPGWCVMGLEFRRQVDA